MKSQHPKYSNLQAVKDSPFLMKNILLGASLLINYKVTDQKEWAFRCIMKKYGLQSAT